MRSAFWWTYAGTVIGTVWMMAFGSIAVAIAANSFSGGSTAFIVGLGGSGVRWLISLIIVLGIVAVNVLNLYGMFMCVTTTLTALRPLEVRQGVRLVFVVASAIVGTAIAIAATSNFLTNLRRPSCYRRVQLGSNFSRTGLRSPHAESAAGCGTEGRASQQGQCRQ